MLAFLVCVIYPDEPSTQEDDMLHTTSRAPRFTLAGLGLLALVVLLSAIPALAESPAEVGDLEAMLTEGATEGDCAPPESATPPPVDDQPELVFASGSADFYACLDDDSFCGGCPSGTHCAWAACGDYRSCCITGQVACVSSCTFVSCGCLASSCS